MVKNNLLDETCLYLRNIFKHFCFGIWLLPKKHKMCFSYREVPWFLFWKFSFKGMKFSETLVSWILIRWRKFWNFRLVNFANIFPSGNISTFYSILSCASTNGTRKNLKVSFDSCFVCNESKWFSCQWASRFSLSDLNPGPVHREKKKVIKKFIFKGFILDEMNWLSEHPTTDSLVHPEY